VGGLLASVADHNMVLCQLKGDALQLGIWKVTTDPVESNDSQPLGV